MLSELTIRNFALIDKLTIEFDTGFNIITGETGAGKSIVIGALQLLLGQRPDKSQIRQGADHCDVHAVYTLGEVPATLKRLGAVLDDAGAQPCDDGQLIVSRRITSSGVKNYINAAPTTARLLRDVGGLLVDVHGPYDHQSLAQPARQLAYIDAFATLGDVFRTYQTCYGRLSELRQEMAACKADAPPPDQIDIIRHQIREIRDADLQPDEDTDVTTRHAVAANSRQILELLNAGNDRLAGENGVTEILSAIMRDLLQLERYDADTSRRLTAGLDDIMVGLTGLEDELNDYAQRIDIDPAEFNQLEQRLAVIRKLKQKYGDTVADILHFADKAEARLAGVDNLEARLAAFRQQIADAETDVAAAARELSGKRQRAAKKLAKAITAQLRNLGFEKGAFSIELTPTEPGPTGADRAEFYFSPNPGEGSKMLRQIASSGEIARVMLAVKTILADVDDTPVLVFDEIDVNIGGVVAGVVGAELYKLAGNHQVICITHLPQVAAAADRHFQVSKALTAGRTTASVTVLDDPNRVAEIARMLGGEDASSVVMKHAAELIDKHKKPAVRS